MTLVPRSLLLSMLLVSVAAGLTGCRLTRGQGEVVPLTDDLAERLQGHIRAVLRRARGGDAGEESTGDIALAGGELPAARPEAIERIFGPPPPIPGAGYSHETIGAPPPTGALGTVTPWGTRSQDKPPGRRGLALPVVGNVPDMARRLIPPLPLWPGVGKPDVDVQEAASSALDKLIEEARDAIDKLPPGRTDADRRLYVRQHVYLRLLSLIGDQPQEALAPVPGLKDAEQEFWQNVFWAAANYFDAESMPEPADRATQTIGRLDSAIRSLQPLARLTLKHLTLCRQVTGFGIYEPFAKNEFSSDQGVLLYVEIGNFTSRPTSDGGQRTLLRSTITIQQDSPQGGVIEKIHVAATEDICRTTRRDYFHNYEFVIPRTLPLGRYLLTLSVTDVLGQKTASESLRLTVR